MQTPTNLSYSKEHTWLAIDGETGKIGITEFAQTELGEIVFVDLPATGKVFKQDEVFGSVEAVKTVSDLFMPVSGEIIETNSLLKEQPTLINNEPFENGWMVKIKISNPAEVENLLTADSYLTLTGS